nr:tRNA preQ1(34) S-adenosylmethionine ribosyltransferase-isomerase QueA [Spirochaeta sp.]
EGHVMHREKYDIPVETAELIEETRLKRGRVLAVGTTVVRALESAYHHNRVRPGKGETDIFIYPGYHFQVVDQLLTNFHTPESTLLLLAAAFAGKEQILGAYQKAVAAGYSFFSYGDAMLIQ